MKRYIPAYSIITAIFFFWISTPTAAVETCQFATSDPDGDGWGWEQGASCRVPSITMDGLQEVRDAITGQAVPAVPLRWEMSDIDGKLVRCLAERPMPRCDDSRQTSWLPGPCESDSAWVQVDYHFDRQSVVTIERQEYAGNVTSQRVGWRLEQGRLMFENSTPLGQRYGVPNEPVDGYLRFYSGGPGASQVRYTCNILPIRHNKLFLIAERQCDAIPPPPDGVDPLLEFTVPSSCDYSEAGNNNGWGWDPVNGQSCPPPQKPQ